MLSKERGPRVGPSNTIRTALIEGINIFVVSSPPHPQREEGRESEEKDGEKGEPRENDERKRDGEKKETKKERKERERKRDRGRLRGWK